MKTSSLLFILSLASHQTILAAAKQTLDPLKGLDPARELLVQLGPLRDALLNAC